MNVEIGAVPMGPCDGGGQIGFFKGKRGGLSESLVCDVGNSEAIVSVLEAGVDYSLWRLDYIFFPF